MKSRVWTAAVCALVATQASAQAPPINAGVSGAAPVAIVASPAADACCRLTAGAVVLVELAETVSARTAKRGDHFALRLVEPVFVDGHAVLSAGAPGAGEVVDAAAAGLAGKPAKLILAARYLEFGGVRVALHGFRMAGGGQDNSMVAAVLSATPYVGLLAVAIPGGDVAYPMGTRANAKVTVDVSFPAPSPLSPTPPPIWPPKGTAP